MYTPPSKCSQYNQPPFHLMEGGRGIWNAGQEAEPARQRCQCCSQHWLARTCVTHGRGVQDCTRKRFLSSSSARRIDGDRPAIVLDGKQRTHGRSRRTSLQWAVPSYPAIDVRCSAVDPSFASPKRVFNSIGDGGHQAAVAARANSDDRRAVSLVVTCIARCYFGIWS